MNSFLFIIPRTPLKFRNAERDVFWNLCLNALRAQSYSNWQALVIDDNNKVEKNIRYINSKAITKREKIDFALNEIQKKWEIKPDFIIRLDDDDIINPFILERLGKRTDFDIYTDKWQSFWDYSTGKIAQSVHYHFPNSCIIRTEHALNNWDFDNKGEFRYMINNQHNNFHQYFKNKKIAFSSKRHPIYLRTISNNSITANLTSNFESYMNDFGIWRKHKLPDFIGSCKSDNDSFKQSIRTRLKLFINNLIALKNYKKVINR